MVVILHQGLTQEEILILKIPMELGMMAVQQELIQEEIVVVEAIVEEAQVAEILAALQAVEPVTQQDLLKKKHLRK